MRPIRRAGRRSAAVVLALAASLATTIALSACGSEKFVGPLTTKGDPVALLCGEKTGTAVDQLRLDPPPGTSPTPPPGAPTVSRDADGGACTYDLDRGSLRLTVRTAPSAGVATAEFASLRTATGTVTPMSLGDLADEGAVLRDGSALVRRGARTLRVEPIGDPPLITDATSALALFFLQGLCH